MTNLLIKETKQKFINILDYVKTHDDKLSKNLKNPKKF